MRTMPGSAMAKGSKKARRSSRPSGKAGCCARWTFACRRGAGAISYHYSDNVLLMSARSLMVRDTLRRACGTCGLIHEARTLHTHPARVSVQGCLRGMVHGDLSEYNIPMSGEGPVIIDLPQATDAAHNRNSERLFLRDLKNLKHYLVASAPSLKKTQYRQEIRRCTSG